MTRSGETARDQDKDAAALASRILLSMARACWFSFGEGNALLFRPGFFLKKNKIFYHIESYNICMNH
jgi:hypothetical protein